MGLYLLPFLFTLFHFYFSHLHVLSYLLGYLVFFRNDRIVCHGPIFAGVGLAYSNSSLSGEIASTRVRH